MNEKHTWITCQTCHEPVEKVSDTPEQWRCPHWSKQLGRCMISDCPIHKIRLETKRGDYKTQIFEIVKPFCTICEEMK